jgi:hypothetical protein
MRLDISRARVNLIVASRPLAGCESVRNDRNDCSLASYIIGRQSARPPIQIAEEKNLAGSTNAGEG